MTLNGYLSPIDKLKLQKWSTFIVICKSSFGYVIEKLLRGISFQNLGGMKLGFKFHIYLLVIGTLGLEI